MVGKKGGFLRAKVDEADQLLPPVKGWESWDRDKWDSDQTPECSGKLSPACSEITVELTGGALNRLPMFAGSYLPAGRLPVKEKFVRGRPVGSFEKHLNNDLVVGSQFAIGFIINGYCYETNSNIIVIHNIIVFFLSFQKSNPDIIIMVHANDDGDDIRN